MPARIRPGRIGIVMIACVGFISRADAAPAEPPVKPQAIAQTADALIEFAEIAERKGQWEKALEFYLRAFLAGRQTPEVREKVRLCLRHASQARRHRDAGFQQFVLALPPADALNLYAEVIGKLQANYTDRDRATPERLFGLGLEELDRALADKAFRDKHLTEASAAAVSKFRRSLSLDWHQRSPRTSQEARQVVFALTAAAQQELGLRNPSAVVFEFLCGACTGLDEYTVYLSPSQEQSELASPILELASYGLLIAYQSDGIVVEGIVPNSWAAIRTPLQAGDRIVGVNGRNLDSGGLPALAEALRTPIGGGHEIEIASAMGLLSTQTIQLPIPVPTVLEASILSPKDGIGYIRLAGLREPTPDDVDLAILELRNQGMRALILDLRGNTGGRFSAGVQLAQRFIPSGIIATTQGQAAEFANRVFSSDSGMAALDIPLVLLIDTKTMSAAEIVAGALKDHGRATLVGMPTFGKGAILYPFPLRGTNDDPLSVRPRSGVLIMTIAKAFSPRGTAINGVGVTPHLVESDPQRQLGAALEQALELLGGQ